MDNPTNHLILSSSSIEDTKVRNLADDKLGDIKDIMLDVDSGRIVYAVISVNEGFLGMNNKYFAIPWKALRFDTDREIALLDISKEKLEKSPGFDKDNWPARPQREFVDEVHTYYGYEPFYNRAEERAFETNVNNPNMNRNMGEGSMDRGDMERNTGNMRRNDPNYNRNTDEPMI